MKDKPFTDMGNSVRFVERHGKALKYSHELKSWFIWSGRHWEQDRTERIVTLGMETLDNLYKRAVAKDDEKLTNLAKLQQGAHKITAMIQLARTDSTIAVTASAFDNNIDQLNVQNGTINLRTGILGAHLKEDMNSHLSPVEYHPNARHALWDKLVLDICCGDKEYVKWLQTAIGHTITGSTRDQVLFVCYGKRGQNGKSTFLTAIKDVLGPILAQRRSY